MPQPKVGKETIEAKPNDNINEKRRKSITLLRKSLEKTINIQDKIDNLDRRRSFLEHDTLIKVMQRLGYDANEDGVCFGFSLLGIQAILVGAYEQFEERCHFINSLTPSKIIEKLQNLKERLNVSQGDTDDTFKLSEEDEKYLDLLVFFDNINIAHTPQKFTHLFPEDDQPLAQNIRLTTPFITSIELQNIGGLVELEKRSGVYSRDELELLLNDYKNKVKSSGTTIPFMVLGMYHAMVINYDAKKDEWNYLNSNTLKKFKLTAKKEKSTLVIADWLHKAYIEPIPGQNLKDKFIALTILPFTSGNDKKLGEEFSEKFYQSEAWKILHGQDQTQRIDEDKNTWAHMAARYQDNPNSLKDLNFKNKINFQNNKGKAPLIVAIQSENLEMIQFMLDQGADINTQDKSGLTSLHYAIYLNNAELVKLLLQKGSDLKTLDSRRPLLHTAVSMNNKAIVNLLLDYGADVDEPDYKGRTPFMIAIAKDNREMSDHLLNRKKMGKLQENKNLQELINHVSESSESMVGNYDFKDKIKFLQNKFKESIQNKDITNYELLRAFIEKQGLYDGPSIFQFVMKINPEMGLHLIGKEKIIDSDFVCLIEQGHLAHLNDILAKNAKLATLTLSTKRSPLHHAAYAGQNQIVNLLIKKGADVNEKSSTGKTPLFFAAFGGHLEVCETLINHGAKNILNQDGVSPFYAARSGQQDSICKILLANKLFTHEDFMYAIEKQNVAEVKAMLAVDTKQEIIQINPSNGRKPPLHLAAKQGNEEIINLLIENKANKRKEYSGNTAAEVAKKYHPNNKKLIQSLAVIDRSHSAMFSQKANQENGPNETARFVTSRRKK